MKLNDKRKKSLYLIIPIFTATLAIVGAQATNLFRKPINIDAIDSEYSIIFSKDDNDIESKKIKTNDNNELYFSVSGLGSSSFENSKDYIAIVNYDKPFEFKNNYMPELPNCNRITGIKEINIDYSIVLGTYSDPDYTNTELQIDLYIDYGWDINLQNNEYYGSAIAWYKNSFTNQPSFFRIFSEYNDTPSTIQITPL